MPPSETVRAQIREKARKAVSFANADLGKNLISDRRRPDTHLRRRSSIRASLARPDLTQTNTVGRDNDEEDADLNMFTYEEFHKAYPKETINQLRYHDNPLHQASADLQEKIFGLAETYTRNGEVYGV